MFAFILPYLRPFLGHESGGAVFLRSSHTFLTLEDGTYLTLSTDAFLTL